MHLFLAHYCQHQYFLFYNDFCNLVIITKDSLIDSWNIYNLIGKFLTLVILLGISEHKDFHRLEIALEKSRETDKEARISKKAEMERKFNRNQKRITPWHIQLSSLASLIWVTRKETFINCKRSVWHRLHKLMDICLNV